MKVLGLAIALLILVNTASFGQVHTSTNDRFEVSLISKSLNQQGTSGNAMVGLEVSLYNKPGTFSFSAFALTNLSIPHDDNLTIIIANDRISNDGTFRRDFNAVGVSIHRQFLSKNKFELSFGSALSQIWFDETVRDSDLISYGLNGFIALEPSANFSYQISNRLSFKLTPSYLFALGEERIGSFQQLNIGAGLGIRF